ncbi:MAG: hypothetical protein JXA46_13795, partial [Dehalococcoidales bacterium]|nr:hypothetical protein [Dehalococcoidales bacterium]
MSEYQDLRENWKYRLPRAGIVNNSKFYCELKKGKSVLHIGCTDHLEIIDDKNKKSNYLHMKLGEYASVLRGVDINKEAIDNLGVFLHSVKKFMSSRSILAIGTPNALKIYNSFTVLKGYEKVNPDHRYLSTPVLESQASGVLRATLPDIRANLLNLFKCM